jgi:hypothetical protein
MDDLLAVLLSAIFEILGEALIEILLGLAADLVSRMIRRFFVASRRIGPVFTSLMFAIAGYAAGFLSLTIFPRPLVHPSHFHGVSLLISPIVTGLAMALLGSIVRRRGRKSAQIETFGYGFVFALAMALVRFFLVK